MHVPKLILHKTMQYSIILANKPIYLSISIYGVNFEVPKAALIISSVTLTLMNRKWNSLNILLFWNQETQILVISLVFNLLPINVTST